MKIIILLATFFMNLIYAAEIQKITGSERASTEKMALLQKKAQESVTPLMEAAHSGNAEKVQELLLDAKTNINSTDIHRRTALIYAINANQPKIVQILLNSKNLDVNIKDHVGWTALMYAIEKNNQDIIYMLLKSCNTYYNENLCSNVNVRDKVGITPLVLALQLEDEKLIDSLVQKGADTNVMLKIRDDKNNPKSITALDFVIDKKFLNSIENFMPISATPTVLMIAAKEGDFNSFITFNSIYPNGIFYKDLQGRTVLHYAAEGNEPQIIKEILKIYKNFNINPRMPDNDGLTPFLLAIEMNNVEAVKILL